MPETAKTCQVEMLDGKPCGRELYDDECCIFHSENEDKDVGLFQKGLDGILRLLSIETHDLTRFIFPEGIIFPMKFPKSVIFLGAVFKGETNFYKVTFEQEADFDHAVFKGQVNFEGAVFKGTTSFWRAVFQFNAYFMNATFEYYVTFRFALFEAEAHFPGADFDGGVSFNQALFKGGVYFGSSTFGGWASFEDTAFEDEASFKVATFEHVLSIRTERHDKNMFSQEVNFRSVEFLNPEKVGFQKIDLSRVRFLGTDLRKVHFSDVDWHREKGKGRNMIFDEVSSDPKTKKFDYALIAQLYRRLRANYEENLRYSEAGDFYIGEMEMMRKAEKNIFKKLPLLFYKAISNYGESYYRPLGWIAAILVIFPLLFMFAGIQPVSLDPNNPIQDVIRYKLDFSSTESLLPTTEEISDYYSCFLYSMSVFSFIRDKKYTTIDNRGHTLFVLESILSPITLAFFLLALRRRFKR